MIDQLEIDGVVVPDEVDQIWCIDVAEAVMDRGALQAAQILLDGAETPTKARIVRELMEVEFGPMTDNSTPHKLEQ